MAVTTLADVEAALVRSLTADELAHTDRIIAQVEADVLLRLPGYDLNPASVETVTLPVSYEETLILPRYPVLDVTSVTQGGATVDAAGYTWSSKGYLSRQYGWAWSFPTSAATVTYTHGQGPDGSPLVAVIAEIVAERLSGAGRDGLRSMSLGDYSESYGDTAGSSGADRRRLAPYRRSSIGSVRLVG